jgi:hypothetical protein
MVAQPGGAGFPEFGAWHEAGAQGIEFDVEEAFLEGFGIEEFGVFEAIGPEVTVSIEAAIEPFGVFAVDVLHESGDVEEFVVELLPGSGRPGEGFLGGSVSVESGGALAELSRGERAEGLEEEDQVVVVAHDLVGSELAAVGGDIEADDFEEFLPGLRVQQREVVGGAGNASEDVVKGFIGTFETGSSQAGPPDSDSPTMGLPTK